MDKLTLYRSEIYIISVPVHTSISYHDLFDALVFANAGLDLMICPWSCCLIGPPEKSADGWRHAMTHTWKPHLQPQQMLPKAPRKTTAVFKRLMMSGRSGSNCLVSKLLCSETASTVFLLLLECVQNAHCDPCIDSLVYTNKTSPEPVDKQRSTGVTKQS